MSRRDAVLVAVVIAIWAGVLTVYVGPTFINPLPMWEQVVVAVACCVIIATIAIYGRRRSRRRTSSP
jgi:membrane protein implicated in regulation of membrane protease activity